MLPWSLSPKFKCDLNQLRQLLFDAIKQINQKINRNSIDHHEYAIPIYENLIYLELTLKRYDIALKLCDRFIKINSNLIHLVLLKLYISIQLDNPKQAFESVLEIYPSNAQIHLFVAQFFVSQVSK
jgi:tetratricopeptide (TPR) repeat protein